MKSLFLLCLILLVSAAHSHENLHERGGAEFGGCVILQVFLWFFSIIGVIQYYSSFSTFGLIIYFFYMISLTYYILVQFLLGFLDFIFTSK